MALLTPRGRVAEHTPAPAKAPSCPVGSGDTFLFEAAENMPATSCTVKYSSCDKKDRAAVFPVLTGGVPRCGPVRALGHGGRCRSSQELSLPRGKQRGGREKGEGQAGWVTGQLRAGGSPLPPSAPPSFPLSPPSFPPLVVLPLPDDAFFSKEIF